jgi:hypothetical protein
MNRARKSVRFIGESVFALALWSLFIFGWFRVLGLFETSELVRSIVFLASATMAYGTGIVLWVMLCVRRARVRSQERGEETAAAHSSTPEYVR